MSAKTSQIRETVDSQPKAEGRDGNGTPSHAVARLVALESGEILYANAALERLAGVEKTLAGRNLFDVARFAGTDPSAPSFQGGAHEIFFLKTEEGERQKQQAPAQGKAGREERPAILQFDWIRRADGQRFLVASSIADDSAFAEEIVAGPATAAEGGIEDAQDLGMFLAMSNDVMAVMDMRGGLARSNRSFQLLFGIEGAIRPGQVGFVDLVHAQDKADVRAALKRLARQAADHEGKGEVDFECRMSGEKGRPLWMAWRLCPKAGKIYAVGQDVTATKQHEDILSRKEQQLLEAESIGHMGHWRWRVGQSDIEWSDEIYRIFGVARDSFVPGLESVNRLLHKRDLGRMIQAFQRAMIGKNNYDMDFRVVRPDGTKRYVRCQGRCELDSEGEVVALFGIMQDITETHLHERALRKARDDAERAYAAKSQFLANMSHELRTPLNAIIGFSEMIERQLLGPIGTDRYLDYIHGIRESGEHLLDLITDILDMSKIEAGKYRLTLERFNLAKVIGLAAHMMEGRAIDSAIKLETHIANKDLEIIADRRAVMQICLNLLSNAVKFSKPEGRVSVEVAERENYVSLKVHDEGIGIPANKLQAIVRPFEQAASHYTREHEGSGLGLAITKELIELHGGTMHIESAVNVGTTVTVRLPYDASFKRQDVSDNQPAGL